MTRLFGMKQISQCLLLGLSVLAVSGNRAFAASGTAESPYASIAERNVFGLKPAPPPAAPDLASSKPPAPKVTLLGITTLLGKKRALLKTTPPATAGIPAKEQSLMLAEGQRDGDLVLVHVDEKAAIVTVDDCGTITNITFDKDCLKPPAASAAVPGTVLPMPTSRPLAPNQPALGGRAIPNRNLRIPSSPAVPQPAAVAQSAGQQSITPEEQLLLTALQPEQPNHDAASQTPQPPGAAAPHPPSLPATDPRLAPRGELPNE